MQFEKEGFSLTAKREEKPLPQGNKHLLEWAEKEYGAVTSFTEFKISRNVYIKVGEGKSVEACMTVNKKQGLINVCFQSHLRDIPWLS